MSVSLADSWDSTCAVCSESVLKSPVHGQSTLDGRHFSMKTNASHRCRMGAVEWGEWFRLRLIPAYLS